MNRIRLTSVSLLSLAAGAFAQTNISLSMASLPSAQGWTYYRQGTSVSEGSVFSVGGNALHQNSVGIGFQGQGAVGYYLSVAGGANMHENRRFEIVGMA